MKDADIFVVEDDESLQRSLVRVLGGAGYTVYSHLGAESLLADLHARQPDGRPFCVLLDVNLTGINGVDAQKLIRQIDTDIPVVFMSGHPDAVLVNQAWRDGACNFLFKPFTPKELLDALQEALGSHRQVSSPAAQFVPSHEQSARVAKLTLRQRQVLVLLTQGLTHEKIGSRIGIATRTVKLHRASLMQRLQCKNLTELVRLHDACRDQLAATELPPVH